MHQLVTTIIVVLLYLIQGRSKKRFGSPDYLVNIFIKMTLFIYFNFLMLISLNLDWVNQVIKNHIGFN
jgi:hypothetical protein